MNRRTVYTMIGAVAFLIVGVIVGFFIGTSLGGNYFPDFEFLGGRGYEAVGYLGMIIGGLVGVFVGAILGKRMGNKKKV